MADGPPGGSERRPKPGGRAGKNRPAANGRGSGGRYIPPNRRNHGKTTQNLPGGGRVVDDGEGAADSRNSESRPQKGRGPRGGGTSQPKHFKGQKNNRRQGDRQPPLRVYSSPPAHHSDGEDGNNNNIRQTSFFEMHRACGAKRYKVHKPRTDCAKIVRLVDRNREAHNALSEVTREDEGTIDALVIVPDPKTKSSTPSFVYVCTDTSAERFARDPFGAERKLRDEVFPPTAHDSLDETDFKLSCASCLLQAHEPNGFCLVAAPSRGVVDAVRDASVALRNKKEASGVALHQDHAHFVATLPRSILWRLHRSKTRAQTSQSLDAALGHLAGQGVGAASDPERLAHGIKLGHHLASVLGLTKPSEDFWWVMGYDDGTSLELDLPGGKRHLGETSLEGAIRETEEETSLVWDPAWVTETLQSHKASEAGNRYFVLSPPASFLECAASPPDEP